MTQDEINALIAERDLLKAQLQKLLPWIESAAAGVDVNWWLINAQEAVAARAVAA